MCEVTEVVITGVLHPNSKSLTLWLTESDKHGQFELIGMIDGVSGDIASLFERLRNSLTLAGFHGDVGSDR